MTGHLFRRIFIGAAVLAVLLLGFFAWSLADSQSQARQDLENRFSDRAGVSAALTDAIFSISAVQTQTQAARRFSGEVDRDRLVATARQSRLVYARIVGSDGEVLATTPGAPSPPPDREHVQRALRGRATLTNVLRVPGVREPVIEWALPFRTPQGPRVQVNGLSERIIARFLGGFLGQLPQRRGTFSYVLDSRGTVLGSPQRDARPGERLGQPGLLAAVRGGRKGKYQEHGEEHYFTSTAVRNTPWRVVLAAETDELYSSVHGRRRTIPWLIFGAFALASLVGLFLLRRVATTTSELERRELSRQHAVEINDNIIQRLVLAKYELDRGASEISQAKVSETLQEAQRLVSDLLGDADMDPGRLRRRGPASAGEER